MSALAILEGHTVCHTYECRNVAEGFLLDEKCKPVPGSMSCRACAEPVIAEYAKKLGEQWQFSPGTLRRDAGNTWRVLAMDLDEFMAALAEATDLRDAASGVLRGESGLCPLCIVATARGWIAPPAPAAENVNAWANDAARFLGMDAELATAIVAAADYDLPHSHPIRTALFDNWRRVWRPVSQVDRRADA